MEGGRESLGSCCIFINFNYLTPNFIIQSPVISDTLLLKFTVREIRAGVHTFPYLILPILQGEDPHTCCIHA